MKRFRKPQYRESGDRDIDQDRRDLSIHVDEVNDSPLRHESLDAEELRCEIEAVAAGASDVRRATATSFRRKLEGARLIIATSLGANAASFRNFQLQKWKTVNGVATQRGVAASRTTEQAGITADVAYQLTLSGAEPDLIFDVDDVALLSIGFSGAGPALAPGALVTHWRRLE